MKIDQFTCTGYVGVEVIFGIDNPIEKLLFIFKSSVTVKRNYKSPDFSTIPEDFAHMRCLYKQGNIYVDIVI